MIQHVNGIDLWYEKRVTGRRCSCSTETVKATRYLGC